jgi:hypothetical protein
MHGIRAKSYNFSNIKNYTANAAAVKAAKAVAERRRQGLKRKRRFGQRPPRRFPTVTKDATLDFVDEALGSDGYDDLGSDGPERMGTTEDGEGSEDLETGDGDDGNAGSKHSAWQQRLHRTELNWSEQRSSNCQQLRRWYYLTSPKLHSDAVQTLEASMASRMAAAKDHHACCGMSMHLTGRDVNLLQQPDYRQVHYHTLGADITINVPSYHCSLCNEVFEIAACDVGCFGSSPVVANDWYDLKLMELFEALTYSNGSSATAFCSALRQVAARQGAEQPGSSLGDRYALKEEHVRTHHHACSVRDS